MTQTPCEVVSYDDLDHAITVILPDKRVEFLVGDHYRMLKRTIPRWQNDGWYNHLLAQLLQRCYAIYINGQRAQKEEFKTMADYRKTPSEEFSFTVIATVAKSLKFPSDRQWFKTQDDAKQFAAEVFDYEHNRNSGPFELAIVQCVDVVRPRPRTEMISTFKKVAEESEG